MPIQSGDIKFVKSQVMADVPEGGGAPTSTVIVDGSSNAILPDVTEVDRAGGKFKNRKVFLVAQTDDAATVMDANIIIERPPNDPNVSILLMTTGDVFDRRASTMSRVQAYFAPGTMYGGYLFGNHLAGQSTIAIAQRVGSEVPILGQTLLLRRLEGQPEEVEQFIRVRTVTSAVREFTGSDGQIFKLLIVTAGIEAPLDYDFPGFDPDKQDPTIAAQAARTTVRETIVADAARFYGAAALTEAASINDYSVQCTSIFSELVPSAQVESPIADARTNQLTAGYVPAGGAVTMELSLAFSPTQSLYVGGAALPGSVTIVRDGITLTDTGGRLYNGSNQVGLYDYANGIASLLTDVFGGGFGTHTVTYTPAAVPDAVTQSLGVAVTAESRSMTQVLTLPTKPTRTSLNVAYAVSGRWYVLREDGKGVLRGSDASMGIGQINYSTNTVAMTFGALPDLGMVIYQWVEETTSTPYAAADLANGGHAYVPINTSGLISDEAGAAALERDSVLLEWMVGTTHYTAQDDGFGRLTGDATGLVDYTRGQIRFSPNILPPKDTVLLLSGNQMVLDARPSVVWANMSGYYTVTIAETITPGTVSGRVQFFAPHTFLDPALVIGKRYLEASGLLDSGLSGAYADDGEGNLVMTLIPGNPITVGTVNYLTGTLVVQKSALGLSQSLLASIALTGKIPVIRRYALPGSGAAAGMMGYLGGYALGTGYVFDGLLEDIAPSSSVRFSGAIAGSLPPVSIVLSQLNVKAEVGASYELRNAMFRLGGKLHTQRLDGQVVTDISPETGVGTQVGTAVPGLGSITLTQWVPGDTSAVADWRGAQVAPAEGPSSPYAAASVVFRTAAIPLRPSSVSVSGSLLDGTAFSVTVDANGKINGTRVKGRVGLNTGVVELYAVNPANVEPSAPSVDLSFLGIAGVSVLPIDLLRTATLRYNAVAYSFVPLDANIIGIDPVRLPSDGRVPIFRPGMFGVVGHTATIGPATLTNGQILDCGRTRLSRARLIDANKHTIHSGYTVDLESGLVSINDASDFDQPVTLEHRIEDMGQIRDVQISGMVTFTRPLSHDYPEGAFLSSALYLGDLYARVSVVFSQATWVDSQWSDSLQGDASVAKYDDVLSPIVVTNRGALTERWIILFTNSSGAFRVIGEHVGIIATGTVNEDCQPINPAAGVPYFVLPALGWGTISPSAGNLLRFNTVGATSPVNVLQTIQAGPEAGLDYEFRLLARFDIDRP